jgi:hypothetical protein
MALAIFTLVCGFAVMWASSVGGARGRSLLEDAVNRAVAIEAASPDRKYNGKLVVADSKLMSEEQLGDDYIAPGNYLVLRRRVEMYQWIEDTSAPGETAYRLGWSEGEINSFGFKEPSGHENPLLKISPEFKRASSVRFGGFDGSLIARHISTLEPLSLTPEVLADRNAEVIENKLIIRRTRGAGEPHLGDMRLSYEVLPSGEYTVISVQENERTLVGEQPQAELVIMRGKVSAQNVLAEMAKQAEQGFGALLLIGALVVFGGLVALLAPFAARIDLRPSVALQGMSAVVGLSFGITFVITAVFWVVVLLG